MFNISIGDMDSGIKCTLCKFVGDAKLSDVGNTIERRDAIYRDLETWETGQHEPHEIQQGQVQAAASGLVQSKPVQSRLTC